MKKRGIGFWIMVIFVTGVVIASIYILKTKGW